MSIPVRIGAHRVFEDRVDLVVREAGETVRVSLRLSRAAALALAGQLIAAARDEVDAVGDHPAILEHPDLQLDPKDLAAADPRAPP